ncbi:MAG: phosphate ABC transporter substrate-binding protein [Oscillospiraceae bacterium]|nr:phosphate ABC transporter substrate-binding protein [Oscillospiraceae bacterium]
MKQWKPLLLGGALLLLAACGGGKNGEVSGQVTALGSTSMERVMGVLAEQFRADHRGMSVSVEGGGSSAGIEAVSNGTADLGLSSRELTAEEAEGLTATVLALDGIAVVVNEASGITGLTLEELGKLFRGEIASWAEIDGRDGPVACIGRESGSGTRDGFESATGTEGQCVLAQELTSTGAVLEAVRGNPNAIGYASLASVEGQEGVRMLSIDGVVCTEETVRDGSYPIQRPFLLVTRSDEPLGDAARTFFDWATSAGSAGLIRLAGAVPPA